MSCHLYVRQCVVCNRLFDARRVDAFVCGPTCRKRRSRELAFHEQYRQVDEKIEAAREKGRAFLRELASKAEREGTIDELQ